MIGICWQYSTSKGFDNFSPEDSNKVEGFFQIYQNNREKFQCVLTSSKFSYNIDFSNMTQKNVQTGRTRNLNRKTSASSTIIWEIKYLDKELWLPFNEELSNHLETNFQKNPKSTLQIQFRGIKFTINLEKMTHYYNHMGYKPENLRRIVLPQLPPKILEMAPFIYSKEIEVASIQKKFPLLKGIGTIKKIIKIVHPVIKNRYNELKEKLNVEEEVLFHGTKECYFRRITMEGFKLPNNEDGMLGKGIYFAVDPKKAEQYVDPENKIILVAKVLKSQGDFKKKQNNIYEEYSFTREDILCLKYAIYY